MDFVRGAGWALAGLAVTLVPACVAGVLGGHQGIGWMVGGILLAVAAAVAGWWVYTSAAADYNWLGSRGVGICLAAFTLGAAFSICPLYMSANGIPAVGQVSSVEPAGGDDATHPDIVLAGRGELRYPAEERSRVGDSVRIRYDPHGWFVTTGPDPWGFIGGVVGTFAALGAAGTAACGALGVIGTHRRTRRNVP
ncbi:hypothetical protein OHA72_31620 [Dactylosporangium sp. NBC_01737]|uniref:hypothetical protein n=1 Tax=Dactylosporangium sp. NBC_01737 TaxID=2975959 RepID=UPI002E116448|nr:hypothetical protein OHA72_31620 [Dactylosporangium sp. NBC_01737]